MKLIIFLLALSLEAGIRAPSTKQFCTPQNTSSSSTAFYPLPIVNVFGGAIPQPGQRFCDPVFGTNMLRLTDNSHGDQKTQDLQEAFFSNYVNSNGSVNSKAWVMVIGNGGEIVYYDFNPVAFSSSGVGTVFAPLDSGGSPINGFGELGIWWDNNPADANYQSTILFVSAMKLWKIDISNPANRAAVVVDLTGYFTIPNPPGDNGTWNMQYCSASADTVSIYCAFQADGPYYFGLGWVVFKIGDTTTPAGACPQSTHTCIMAKFINGVDSASYLVYQQSNSILSVNDGCTYQYQLTSDFNAIGYKSTISKDGLWLHVATSDSNSSMTPCAKLTSHNVGAVFSLNDTAIVANRLSTTWTAVSLKFVQSYGHAANAASARGFAIDAGVFCNACIRDYVFSSMTTDPGYAVNSGARASADFGFGTAGLNLTYYGATYPAEMSIGIYGACNRQASDPGGMFLYCNEIIMLKPDTQVVRRIGHMRGPFVSYLDENHPVMSQDGRYVAFGSTFNTVLTPNVVRGVTIVQVP